MTLNKVIPEFLSCRFGVIYTGVTEEGFIRIVMSGELRSMKVQLLVLCYDCYGDW